MNFDVKTNLKKVLSDLPSGVKLVAVSKYHPAEYIMAAYEEGQRIFGESHEQEIRQKVDVLPKDIEWHFIGHLQTNKVKYIAPYIDMIDAVDSMKLLREIKASQMSEESGDYVAIKTSDDRRAYDLLSGSFETYPQENGGIKLYGVDDNARVTSYLYQNGVTVGEMVNRRISLEEYYTRTITAKEAV